MGAKTFFRTALRCTRCGTLNDGKQIDLSSPIGGEPEWDFVEPGEAVDAGVDDLEGPLLLLHRPTGDRVFVLEFFVCASCRAYSPALIELRVRTPYVLEFVGATAIPALTRDVFDKAHFVSDKIREWTPQPGEDPRVAEQGYTFDDRSLTFSLATMVTEWTIGVYPLLQKWGCETTEHMSLYEVPRALREILEHALSPTPADRPALATFGAKLESLA